MSNEPSPLKYFVAGAFGGICTVITGHPLDTIKVRLQVMPGVYKGTWHAVRTIVMKEGPLSLYKGMTAPLIAVVPTFSLSFFSFGLARSLIIKSNEVRLTDKQFICAGMFSGVCTSLITAPVERIKCLLQMQVDCPRKYDGFINCAVKLLRDGGIRNLYAGMCATLLRDVPSTSVFFFTYDRVMRTLMSQTYEITWQPLVAGGFAGLFTWAIGMPADTMKSHLQSAPAGTYPRGIRSVFPVILKNEGVSGFYRGAIPVMLRAFPANAACFFGFELASKFLWRHAPWL